MRTEEYDIEGYFRGDDIRKNERCYSLQHYEAKSISEIQQGLNLGNMDKEQMPNYLSYLDNLELKFSNILITEEKEGLINWELKSAISLIRKLKDELRTLSKEVKLPLSRAS